MIRIQVFTHERLKDIKANCRHDKVSEHQQVNNKYVSSRLDLTLPDGFVLSFKVSSKAGCTSSQCAQCNHNDGEKRCHDHHLDIIEIEEAIEGKDTKHIELQD
jgi:hypothetical protein